MKETNFASTNFKLIIKITRKREFLSEMNIVVPWAELTSLIHLFAPAGQSRSPPFPISTTLHIHLIQYCGKMLKESAKMVTTWGKFIELNE